MPKGPATILTDPTMGLGGDDSPPKKSHTSSSDQQSLYNLQGFKALLDKKMRKLWQHGQPPSNNGSYL